MDAAQINEVLALHGNAMTWETHLAVVERLATWSVDEILDFHETLLGHLATGTWVNTSQNRLVVMEDGRRFDVDRLEETKQLYRTLMERGAETGVPAEMMEAARRSVRELEEWVTGPTVEISIPEGWLGIPIHPWDAERWRAVHSTAESAKARSRIMRAINDVSEHELQLLLRAAPWAYHRASGRRMEGVRPSFEEERFVATEEYAHHAIVHRLRRGAEVVEVIQLRSAWTVEHAVSMALENLPGIARNLGARLVAGERVRRVGGQHLRGIGPPDGQLIWEGAAPLVEPTGSSTLLADLRILLSQTRATARGHRALPVEEFWALIELLGGETGDGAFEALTARLSRKSKATIIAFSESLARALHDLDRPELMTLLGAEGELGMSDDVFLHVRCAIVAAGRSEYERVLSERRIVESEWSAGEAEPLLFVASEAFERRTGEPLDHETAVSYESGQNEGAWEGHGRAQRRSGPVAGYSVRAVTMGPGGEQVEIIRFWRESDAATAIRHHLASLQRPLVRPLDPDLDVLPIVDSMTLPIAVGSAGILFARTVRQA